MASGLFKQRHTHGFSTDFLIGELLVKAGVISQKQLEEAMRLAGHKHLHLGQMLIMCGYLTAQNLQAAVDAQSVLRERSVELNVNEAVQYLKVACKTGMLFAEVLQGQSGHSLGPSNKLGELLLDAGTISGEQFAKAMQRSLATGLPLGRILVLNGALSDALLNVALDVQVKIRDGIMARSDAIELLRVQSAEVEVSTEPDAIKMKAAPRKSSVRLGELLVIGGLLTDTDVMNALETGLTNDQPIGQILVNQGFITPELLEAALALQRLVDSGEMDVEQAGDCLSRVHTTGVSVFQALGEADKVQPDAKPVMNFEKFLTLARIVTTEDIKNAFDWSTKSAQMMAKVLHMTGYVEEDIIQAALRCHYLLSKEWLTQDDALVALDYYRRKDAQNRGTLDEVLQGLGWTANQAIQIEGETDGDSTVVSDLSSTLENMPRLIDEAERRDISAPAEEAKEQAVTGDYHSELKLLFSKDIKQEPAEQAPHMMPAIDQDIKDHVNLDAVAQSLANEASLQGGIVSKDTNVPASVKSGGQTGLSKLLASARTSLSAADAPETNAADNPNAPRGLGKLLAEASKTEKKEVNGHLVGAFSRLAESYCDEGHYAEAQQLYERILLLKENEYGVKHPAIVPELNNLIDVLCVQGKFNQCEPFVRRVISIFESVEPADPIKLADSLNTLAGVYFQQGKFDSCETVLKRCLALKQEILGEGHPDLADTLREYAKLLHKLSRKEEAEQYYARADALVQPVSQNT